MTIAHSRGMTERRAKMNTAPLVLNTSAVRMAMLQYLAQRGDAFLVLIHGADGDADPFRQVVALHRTHDHFALKQCAKDRETIADLHQDKIRGAVTE